MPLVVVVRGDITLLADPGVADDDVEPSEPCGDGVHRGRHTSRIGEVTADRERGDVGVA